MKFSTDLACRCIAWNITCTSSMLQKNESCGQLARRTHFYMGNIWDGLMSIEEIYELAMRPVLSLYNILIALAINS